MYGVVRFNNQPCDIIDESQSWIFCGGSGWGDEEATVVCRNKEESLFGLGGEFTTSYNYTQIAIHFIIIIRWIAI